MNIIDKKIREYRRKQNAKWFSIGMITGMAIAWTTIIILNL